MTPGLWFRGGWLVRSAGLVAAFAGCLAGSGCSTVDQEFIVDTRSPDPTIYPPGSAPDKPLLIPLEGFTLSCSDTQVMVNTKAGAMSFVLANKLWSGSKPFGKTVVAILEPEATADVVSDALSGSFDELEAGLKKVVGREGCVLALRNESATTSAKTAARAANIIQVGLPRRYSAMLRSAYNHRVWPQDAGVDTVGLSVDLFPGMRLRIENSVPIAPAGAGNHGGHPSSFAAPTYLYFHALTGAELCDPGAKPHDNRSPSYECVSPPQEWENKTYLSPNGGLARLGLTQYYDMIDPTAMSPGYSSAKPADTPAVAIQGENFDDLSLDASGLIDLLESSSVGAGARRYWRLWLPAHRITYTATSIAAGGGSTEPPDSTPLLFSADRMDELPYGELADPNTSSEPCKVATPAHVRWTCYSLHYRVVPVPEIVIWVNGRRQWVAIGTTLLDVVAERLHDGFAGRSSHFSSTVEGHDDLADDTPATASDLARTVASSVSVVRLYRDGPHAVASQSLAKSTDVARFLRLQLMPGDEIKWTK